MKKFYVYKYFFKSTNEVFYIGKGCGNRYLDVKSSRNQYFKNIISKYKDDIDVKLIFENLEESEAFAIERKLIKEYWNKNQCIANFHEGGCGGNTGNYDSPIRSKKLSDFGKTRIGPLNPMFGHTHTEETRKKLSELNKGKHLTEEHKQKLITANKGRRKTSEEIEKIRLKNLGKKMKPESYIKMMNSLCQYKYLIYLNNEKIGECLGHTSFYRFCSKNLNISRTIADAVIDKTWTPKFKKHKHLETLRIDRVYNSVSTNRDECSGVE